MKIARYRATFRKKVIPGYYQAKLHIAVFAALEIMALIIYGLCMKWQWWTPLVILLSLFQVPIFSYFFHQFLLHQKVPGLGWAHKIHHWHHTFQRRNKITYTASAYRSWNERILKQELTIYSNRVLIGAQFIV